MRRFLVRIFCFLGVGLVALILTSAGFRILLKDIYQPRNYRVDGQVDTLVVGDSHVQSAINPDYLVGVANSSVNSENYFFTYYKLKPLLEMNPQIRTVVLSYSCHNLNHFYDQATYYERNFDSHFCLLDAKASNILRSASPKFLLNEFKFRYGLPVRLDFRLLGRYFLRPLKAADFLFWGRYYAGGDGVFDKAAAPASIKRHFFGEETGELQDYSDLQFNYLLKIIEMCGDKNVRLCLLMTPLHPDYKNAIPETFYPAYVRLGVSLEKKYSHVHFWDFTDRAYPQFYYGDGDHLNRYGAQVFTREIEAALGRIRDR